MRAQTSGTANDETNQSFEAMLTHVVTEKARALAVGLVAKRFAEAGVRLSRAERQAFDDAFARNGPMPSIQRRRARSSSSPHVELTAEDHRWFGRQLRALTRSATAAIPGLADKAAKKTMSGYTRAWPEHQRAADSAFERFRKRLRFRWRRPLGRLHLLVALARHFGELIGTAVRTPGTSRPHLVDVLTRLHARACQVAFEVYVLLCSGLADGAMARCRTLHEIAATAFFIYEHGEEMAERYVAHEDIESWRAASEFNRHARALKMRPFTGAEMRQIEARRGALLDRFGKSFAGHYGWASCVQKPGSKDTVQSFADIEQAVLPHLRPYYELASHNVHAKAKGIYYRLGLSGEEQILLSGASNAGLADPGQNAALFLAQVSTTLGLLQPNFGSIMLMKTIDLLQRETADAFGRAHHKLREDEERARQKRGRKTGAGSNF